MTALVGVVVVHRGTFPLGCSYWESLSYFPIILSHFVHWVWLNSLFSHCCSSQCISVGDILISLLSFLFFNTLLPLFSLFIIFLIILFLHVYLWELLEHSRVYIMHTFIFIYAFVSLLSRIHFLFGPQRKGPGAVDLCNVKTQFSSWAGICSSVQGKKVNSYENKSYFLAC